MLVAELFENSWSGPDNAWHNEGPDQWYDGNDQWHGQNSGNMIEDRSESKISDIITARELISAALRDPINEKHKYFEFLGHLRTKYGVQYSTAIHQQAATLAKQR